MEHDHPAPTGWRQRQRDAGMSMIEVLVAIVVLSMVAGAVLTTLTVSVNASGRHRDLTTANAWLQSAAAVLEITGQQACTPDVAAAKKTYEEQLRLEAANSGNWDPEQLTVESVQFWNGTGFDDECSGEVQKVRLRTRNPSGRIVQEIDVIVGEPYAELSDASYSGPDDVSSCRVTSVVLSDKKGFTGPFPLKKPSVTKPSKLANPYITFTVTTTGICRGKMRIFYEWPHYSKTVLKHYHDRKMKMKLDKESPGVYVGKLKKDKYLCTEVVTLTVQEHRPRTKLWSTVIDGTLPDALTFRAPGLPPDKCS